MNKILLTTFAFLCLLAVLGVYIFNTNDFSTTLNSFSDVVDSLSTTLADAVEFFENPLLAIGNFFAELWAGIEALFANLLEQIKNIFA